MNTTPCHLRLSSAVRLRRESWGGVAFHRAGGDLLEVDADGFAVLHALKTPLSLPALQRSLRHLPRLNRPELLAFLSTVERRGFIERVARDAPPLPLDRWTEEAVDGGADGLRAP